MMYIVHLYGGLYTQPFLGLFFCRLKLLSSNFPRLRTFFLGFSFPRIYFLQDFISGDFLAAPILFWEKKSQESKTQDFISSDIFFKDLRKFGLFFQSFYFQVFFQKLFFPVTFLHRFSGIGTQL